MATRQKMRLAAMGMLRRGLWVSEAAWEMFSTPLFFFVNHRLEAPRLLWGYSRVGVDGVVESGPEAQKLAKGSRNTEILRERTGIAPVPEANNLVVGTATRDNHNGLFYVTFVSHDPGTKKSSHRRAKQRTMMLRPMINMIFSEANTNSISP